MTATIQAPIKLTPLYAAATRLGARFVEVAGWRFAEAFTDLPTEIAAIRAGGGLADVTPHGKLQIEGALASEAVQAAFDDAPGEIGEGRRVPAGHLVRLRHDQFYLSTPAGGEAAALARLERAIGAGGWFVSVTDLTHAYADLRLIGPASRPILSKLCGLDLAPATFPDLAARWSSVAKTRQLIIRRDFGDLPPFTLTGEQSLSAYLWETVLEAGREFGLRPVGVAALRALETGRAAG